MSATIIRFSNGTIARASSGNILKADFAAGPSPLTFSFDWTCGLGVTDYTPLSISASYTASTKSYYGYSNNPIEAGYPRGGTSLNLSLIIGSGNVRWVGTFFMTCDARIWIDADATIEVNIHKNCTSGKIDPRGTYTVDSYIKNNPNGYGGTWVTQGTTLTLS